MTVRELKAALKGLPGDMQVAMVDEMSVVFAKVIDGVFMVSDLGPGYDEPIEYWRVEDEAQRQRYQELRDAIRACPCLSSEKPQALVAGIDGCEQLEEYSD